jgi:hypothetical protein
VWKYVNATLIAWAMRKYKRYAGRKIQAGQMIGSIANKPRSSAIPSFLDDPESI